MQPSTLVAIAALFTVGFGLLAFFATSKGRFVIAAFLSAAAWIFFAITFRSGGSVMEFGSSTGKRNRHSGPVFGAVLGITIGYGMSKPDYGTSRFDPP